MSKQLGTRCPECGAETAPQVIPYGDGLAVVCVRCGLSARGTSGTVPELLAAFYGPQLEAQPVVPGSGGVVEDDIEEARRRG